MRGVMIININVVIRISIVREWKWPLASQWGHRYGWVIDGKGYVSFLFIVVEGLNGEGFGYYLFRVEELDGKKFRYCESIIVEESS